MEQSIWGKLKRVKISDLIHFFKFLIALPIAIFYKHMRKNMWLLCDTEAEARDNAYWLFIYLRTQHPEKDAVFAIDKKSPDYSRVKKYGEIVQYGSIKHWIYYLAADINISSQKMGKPNAAICYVLEVYGLLKNKRVFLQHGIITAKLSFLFYEHTKMRMFVCSTKAEWQYVDKYYGYPKGYVKELGLCRFDSLHGFHTNKKKILFMPTWRMYIRNEISSYKEEERIRKFKNTRYFKAWNELLHDQRLINLLHENDIELIFYPHREMQSFLHAFQIEDPSITVASWPEYDVQETLKTAALLVTDFSSVSMDFAYMKKPLIYYQFDAEEFYGNHHERGYFDFKTEGFGPTCETSDFVIKEILEYYKNDFENRECYLKRHNEYFDLWDKNNCERTYEAIKELEDRKEL